jgi:hypothetical protein
MSAISCCSSSSLELTYFSILFGIYEKNFSAILTERRYLRFIKEENDRFGVEILFGCLMTNHVQLIAVSRVEATRLNI